MFNKRLKVNIALLQGEVVDLRARIQKLGCKHPFTELRNFTVCGETWYYERCRSCDHVVRAFDNKHAYMLAKLDRINKEKAELETEIKEIAKVE